MLPANKTKKKHKAVGFNFFPLVSDLSLFFSVWADLLVPFSFLLISSVSGGCRLLLLVMAAAGGRWKEAAGMERDGACGWSVGSTPPLLLMVGQGSRRSPKLLGLQ